MSEEDILMHEVEEEISRINNKYKGNHVIEHNFCNETNVEFCIRYLAEELENFDISDLNSEFVSMPDEKQGLKKLVIQLVNSNYDLLQKHKQLLKKEKDSIEKNARVLSDCNHLNKTVDILRKELSLKETQIKVNKDKLLLNKIEKTELQNQISQTRKEMCVIQKSSASELEKCKLEMQKTLLNGKKMEEKFRKNCGKYISTDTCTLNIIDNYKHNEDKYINLIEQLKKNNHELVEELLQHRDHVE